MNFPIELHTHYLVMAGSHSYGCNTPESDIDVRGWAIPPQKYFYSYHLNFEQIDSPYTVGLFPWKHTLREYLKYNCTCPSEPTDSEKIDSSIYSLKKFVKLAADCNPNIIDLLFVDKSDILFIDQYGTLLLENAKLFLSARAKYSFSGYAISQLKRINTHRKWLLDPPTQQPKRKDYGLPEKALISADQRQAAEALIDKQVRMWMLEEAEVDKTTVAMIQEEIKIMVAKLINQPMNLEAADSAIERVAAKEVGLSENYIYVLQKEKQYRQALAHYNQYLEWVKKRNPVRAELEKKFLYDTKHGSALVRLMLEAKEILFTGNLTVKDTERAKIIMEVKQGGWTYEKIMEWVEGEIEILDECYEAKNYKVPKTPDANAIDAVYGELCERALRSYDLKNNFRF